MEMIVEKIKTICENNFSNEYPFVIAIDEVSELILPNKSSTYFNSFRAFRRAMVQLKDLPIVLIILGTMSTLSDFYNLNQSKNFLRKLNRTYIN